MQVWERRVKSMMNFYDIGKEGIVDEDGDSDDTSTTKNLQIGAS